ncbi:MAG TPA: UvrD-helicase domain-containing protein [Bacteroidia bacterium]|nr:UvrD-helicase domain-containing protein [Bacteroidia bacterium]HNU34665.1 UvrD-helicase domain-containing protein [Bacteroidia bacterium]
MPLTIYKSSAGSGKTFTLVLEYLKVVLTNPNHYRQTLAVTFTNKATEEMKERIVAALVGLINGTEQNLEKILSEELGKNCNVKSRAKDVLENILHDYSSFSVNTIDAFFIKIIKAMSYELGLPGKYDVDLNRESAIDEICAGIFSEVGTNKNLTQWLETFVLDKLDNEKGWQIEKELKKIANELFKESYQQLHKSDKNISLEQITEIKKIKSAFENFIQSKATSIIATLKEFNIEPHDFSYGKAGFGNYFLKVINNPSPMDFVPTKRFLDASENANSWFSKSSDKKGLLSPTAIEKILNEMHLIMGCVSGSRQKYFTACAVLNMIYVAGIVSHMQQHLKRYRDENNLFLLSDAQQFLNNVISLSETPFVYEKTGSRYRHFLLDEFQDTSSMQWKNLMPLIENSLSEDSSVLTVGDVKQSIYRWRGADFKLLLHKLQSDLKVFESNTSVKNLSFNYRSAKEIVDFNNRFFVSLAVLVKAETGFKSVGEAYQNNSVEQHVKKEHSGNVVVRFFSDDESETKLHMEPDIKGWKKNALINLYQTIHKLLANGYKQKDITILVNKNRDGLAIADFLFANGFDKIISSDSLLIKNAPQVNFVVNIMRVLLMPSDNVSVCAARWFYIKHLTKAESNFASGNQTDFENLLDSLKKFKAESLTDTLNRVLKTFKLNVSNDSYITALQDVVIEFTAKNTNSVYAFINWWDNDRASSDKSVVISDSEDAIRIMTIHKSKGLQFPVVIMPFCFWKMQPKPDGIIWVSTNTEPFKQLGGVPVRTTSLLSQTYFSEQWETEMENTFLEGLNKMYVAFTRPEEQLYIFAPELKKDAGVKTAEGCLNAAFKSDENFSKSFTRLKDGFQIGKDFVKKQPAKKEKTDNFDNPEVIQVGTVNTGFNLSNIGLKVLKQTEAESTQAQLGISVHELLSVFFDEGDEHQIQKKLSALTDEQHTQKLVNCAIKILKQNMWLSDQYNIYCERDLINSAGEILRPDRLMIKNEKAIVLDYKTGSKDSKHTDQLNQYQQVLTQLGYSNIQKYILYLETEELVSV